MLLNPSNQPVAVGIAGNPSRAVGILGGMGPAAGADFAVLFVQACTEWLQRHDRPVKDQAFPEHWLVQAPVPDRTQALCAGLEAGLTALEAMARGLGQLETVGVRAVAIACNTAHAWHEPLRARFPGLELLHVAQEVAAHLGGLGVREVGLMATQGTYRTQLYETALAQAGIACHLPHEADRETLMRGIYDGVKTGDMALARACFVEVAQHLLARHGDVALIMGCTEIPLALDSAPEAGSWRLVNPARVLACALAQRAYATHPQALPSIAEATE